MENALPILDITSQYLIRKYLQSIQLEMSLCDKRQKFTIRTPYFLLII